MERRWYSKKHCSRNEYLEILDIPENVTDNGLESKVLEILREIDALIDPSLFENCHCLPLKTHQITSP